ncbi:uncharacterized protein LOC107767955 [Nicotiana tabacum]|uniref:Uncharacterized protein LOC107767955 n=1 Tax=Nicotiana tabacum TaxID=4097 RepID=A0A1S3XRH1_TOBAC|nr:PREDICTED: uncharacterized protein LOC107767955 [Nicotiana tabacum]
MASTVPAKSNNPLYNFDFSHLKWKKNHHSNNHQRRRSNKLSSDSSSPSRHDSPLRHSQSQSPMRESLAAARQSPVSESAETARISPMHNSAAAARQSPMRESARQSPMRDPVPSVQRSKHKVPEINVVSSKESRSKILIKIPRKNKSEEIQINEDQNQKEADESHDEAAAAEETAQKTWNLRPRKPIHKSLNINGGVPFRSSGSAMQEIKSQSPHHMMNVNKPENNETHAASAQKKVKRQRFSIALSREEIDEDLYAMTGLKAARRPKKRVKVVQKQLDTLFPGLWLASITPDSYKVCENLPKG